MCCFSVGGLGVGSAVDLDQNEPIRIALLTEAIEARDAGFPHAVAAVFDGGRLERVHELGLHVDFYMRDEHLCEYLLHHSPAEVRELFLTAVVQIPELELFQT